MWSPVINEINLKFLDINDVRAALPKVTAQLESLTETVDDVASKTPSETLLVTLKTSTQKASEKIVAALADISSNSAEIQNLKTSGEKGQSKLKILILKDFIDLRKGHTSIFKRSRGQVFPFLKHYACGDQSLLGKR